MVSSGSPEEAPVKSFPYVLYIFSKNLYFIYSFYVFKKRMYDSLIGDQRHAVSQFVLRVAFVCIDPNLSLWQYFLLRIRQLHLNISVCLANGFFKQLKQIFISKEKKRI